MRYWLDTEFIEDGKTIDLLSIGIVAEDGREFYRQNGGCDLSRAGIWVRENVLPHLDEHKWIDRLSIAREVLAFCDPGQYGKPEFWGYYADYDWVVICQLFGTMMDLPTGWPMYCRDLKQWCDDLGNPKLPEQGKGEHHALADARWNKVAWEFLRARAILEMDAIDFHGMNCRAEPPIDLAWRQADPEHKAMDRFFITEEGESGAMRSCGCPAHVALRQQEGEGGAGPAPDLP